MSKIQVGDKVRLTGKFLRNTGQFTGGEGQSRWTVTAIHSGWAVTDQELSGAALSSWTPEELAADPSLRMRRIAIANLQKVRS